MQCVEDVPWAKEAVLAELRVSSVASGQGGVQISDPDCWRADTGQR